MNDLSDRSCLLHYPLRFHKLNRHRRDRLLRVEPISDDAGGEISVDFRIPLPAEAMQLLSYNVAAKERQLVVRTSESLLYVDANDESEEVSGLLGRGF